MTDGNVCIYVLFIHRLKVYQKDTRMVIQFLLFELSRCYVVAGTVLLIGDGKAYKPCCSNNA